LRPEDVPGFIERSGQMLEVYLSEYKV
jgi:hypothetical protein